MWIVIILFVAGVTLMFSEFLLPGGVLGVIGGPMVVARVIVGWVKFPESGLLIFGGEFVGVIMGPVPGFSVMS